MVLPRGGVREISSPRSAGSLLFSCLDGNKKVDSWLKAYIFTVKAFKGVGSWFEKPDPLRDLGKISSFSKKKC